jgi:hypothetical protein
VSEVSENFIAVVMNSYISSVKMPCSPMIVNRRFGRLCRINFRVEEQANKETRIKQAVRRAGFLAWLTLRPEDGGEILL